MPAIAGRSAAIDGVRVFALAAIVFGHVYATGGTRDLLYAWHVPVFFFLAGWLWRPGRTMRQEWSVRLHSLVVPYAVWLVLVGLAFLALSGMPPLHLLHQLALGGQHIRRPFSAFWYVTAFLALCLLRRALDRFGPTTVTAVAVVLWLGSYPVAHWLAGTPESFGMALPALILLVAGERARTWTPSLPRPGLTGMLLVVGPLCLVATGSVAPVDLKEGTLGTPVAGFAVAVAVSWGLVLVADVVVRRLALKVWWAPTGAALGALAAVALPVMLSHAVILYVLDTPARGRLFDLVAALVVPWALALVLTRTKLSRYLVGEHPRPPRPQLRIVPRNEPAPARPPHLTVVRIPQPRVSVEQGHLY